MSDSLADRMQAQVSRYRELRQHRPDDAVFRERLHALQKWQAARMQWTHRALIEDPVCRDAATFFLQDVYGGVDLTRLTHDIERAMRAAMRILPEKVMLTSLLALEANALSQWLDERVTAMLHEEMNASLTTQHYLEAFRRAVSAEERAYQAHLMLELGAGLDKYVRSRVIHATFRMVRKPALMAGIDALYGFMERGFDVMRPMGSASEIVNRIVDEEQRCMARVYAGDDDPYALGGRDPLA